MRKQEFLNALKRKISGLPMCEVEEHLNFYSEMIDDRMEEGCGEEEAVAEVGSADKIAAQILAETPPVKAARERAKTARRISTWEIVLLVLGFPLWFSLGIAAVSVLFSLYVVLWSLVVSLWAVFVSFAACAFGGVAASVVLFCQGNPVGGTALVGGAVVCAGLSVYLFVGCKAAVKGTVLLTKKTADCIKRCFAKRERVI